MRTLGDDDGRGQLLSTSTDDWLLSITLNVRLDYVYIVMVDWTLGSVAWFIGVS